MTKVYRCFRITINATIIKTTSSADMTIVSDTYILDRTCIEYHHMIADSTYRRGMLIGVEVCYRLHPANQFRGGGGKAPGYKPDAQKVYH